MSAEIAPYNPTPLELTRTQTDDWFDVFPSIVKLAEYVADTEFVPDAMRRRPAAVAAAVLTGRELGLPPMVALRHLFVVKGKVGQSAELMRALILRAGHEIRYLESTDQRCIVEGRRKDEKDWLRVQFTAADAKAAGIDLRGYAADKLVARATSRLARRKFADVIMGLPTVDELEDYSDTASVVELAPTAEGPAVQRKRQPRKPKAAATQPKPAPRPAPADDDDLLDDNPPNVDAGGTTSSSDQLQPPAPTPTDDLATAQANLQAAEILATEITTTDDDVAALPIQDEPPPPATKAQHAKLQTIFKTLDITERNDQLVIISYILGYDVGASRSVIDKNQASHIIDTLENWEPDGLRETLRELLNEAALRDASQQDLLDELDDDTPTT